MSVFEYNALNGSGRKVRGLIDADSLRSARQKLKAQGIFPTDIRETRQRIPEGTGAPRKSLFQRSSFGGVGGLQIAMATRQLATLVGSGMPLVDSLRALADLVEQPTLRRVIAEVTDRVNEGSDLADAMRHYPRIFSRLYVNMIASGQENGRLDLVLERLSDLLEAQAVLRRKILSAITYPVIMLLLCIGAVIILLTFVVPTITAIFEQRGQQLPVPTRIVIGMSQFLQSYWIFLVAIIALSVVGITRFIQSKPGRERFDQFRLKMPLFGPLNLKVATSQFARNLGTLLASDVPLLEALRIVKNIVSNVQLERAIEKAAEGVQEGRSLSKELAKSGVFPTMLIHMTAAGETSGERLSHMLLRAAASYESEVNAVISALTSILEPILIVVLAALVGGILFAVILPMLEMTKFGVH